MDTQYSITSSLKLRNFFKNRLFLQKKIKLYKSLLRLDLLQFDNQNQIANASDRIKSLSKLDQISQKIILNLNTLYGLCTNTKLLSVALGWIERCICKIMQQTTTTDTTSIIKFYFPNDKYVEKMLLTQFYDYTKKIFIPYQVIRIKGASYREKFELNQMRPASSDPLMHLSEIVLSVSNQLSSIQIVGVVRNDPMYTYRHHNYIKEKQNKVQHQILSDTNPDNEKYKLADNVVSEIIKNIPQVDFLAKDIEVLAAKIKIQIKRLSNYSFLQQYYASLDKETDNSQEENKSVNVEINNTKLNVSNMEHEFSFMKADEQLWIIGNLFAFDKEVIVATLLSSIANDMKTCHALIKNISVQNYLRLITNAGWVVQLLDLAMKIEDVNNNINNKQATIEQDDTFLSKIKKMLGPEKAKQKAHDMLKTIERSNDGAPKSTQYLEALLRIPFEQYRNEINQYRCEGIKRIQDVPEEIATKRREYINSVQEKLDKAVHGHDRAKKQINRLLAQWITGGLSGTVIGIQGPPGNGKTTLVKNGLAKCLVCPETGETRPVGFIALGGSSHGSTLEGHGFTFQGSKWGRIADILMDSKCMNPILLFDELDKVSKSDSGKEIIGILTHLTDPSQNKEFNDRYFDGIPLDLSKAIIIFTFNDLGAIDPILRDRITLIETKALTIKDKIEVTRKHILPELCEDIGMETDQVQISDETIVWLIDTYTAEAGARQLRRLLVELIQDWNLQQLNSSASEQCLVIDIPSAKETLDYMIPRRNTTINETDIVGHINGMYCNALGLGGILPIQVAKGNNLGTELLLTGQQGDVMKESMNCARTIAMNLISESQFKDKLSEFSDKKLGLHIHCPSTSIPKDGPSAGGAIATAIYSQITGLPIKKDVSMTGEIDLNGNITAIGGLGPKLKGAKQAGITLALYPVENETDMEKLRKEGESPEDDNFKVKAISTVKEAIQYAIVCEDH